MTNQFVPVSWNLHKRAYDGVIALAVILYLSVFFAASIFFADNPIDPMVAMIRAAGTLAIIMLHIILCIGPLARICDRFAPLLYNRRHLGVTMFFIALIHAALVLLYYGGFGTINPISAVLLNGRSFGSVTAFPYELLGFAGLMILFLMAATSHDFWLATLGPAVWKWLHMSVYVAYFLLIGHVALGVGADPGQGTAILWILGAGVVCVTTLHLITGLRELICDETGDAPIQDDDNPDPALSTVGWVEVGSVDDIPEDRAKVVCLKNAERVAIFKHEGRVSAVSNVCAHQAGPLGEGKIINGCITCPWHGYQYHAHNGQSPPPYTEKIPTYRVRVDGRTILLDPRPLPPGTPIEPVFYEASADDELLFENPDVDETDAPLGYQPSPDSASDREER